MILRTISPLNIERKLAKLERLLDMLKAAQRDIAENSRFLPIAQTPATSLTLYLFESRDEKIRYLNIAIHQHDRLIRIYNRMIADMYSGTKSIVNEKVSPYADNTSNVPMI